MRELIAKLVAVLTVAALAGLSAVFARVQNPESSTASMPAESTVPAAANPEAPTPPSDTLRARILFAELGCTGCHSVGDLGNPRNPLDGIGARRTPESIRAWSVGDGAVADSLPAGALRLKRTYTEVPEADLDLIVAWLHGLTIGN
jgi:hypothetical protein